MACKVAIAALEVLREEKMSENSMKLGNIFRQQMNNFQSNIMLSVRGKGLMNAIEIKEGGKVNAWELCLRLRDNGLLAKPTHGNIIRLTPPLCMTEEQLMESVKILQSTIKDADNQKVEMG